MRSILAVPRLSSTSATFRARLWELADRHGWDVDSIAAVISRESGFQPAAKNPHGSAVGLLQFIRSTLQGLGYEGDRDSFARLSAEEQLPWVERYYERAFGAGSPRRPVDYYLVTWGARAGLPENHVLATQGEEVYRVNAALDLDRDGQIKVSDLRNAVDRTMAAAHGQRLSAELSVLDQVKDAASLSGWVPWVLAVGVAYGVSKWRLRR